MVKRSRTKAHRLTAPKIGKRAPEWEKWPKATKCSPRPLRDGLRDLSLPSGKEIEKIEPGSQTEAKHKRVRKSGGKARSRDSKTSRRARYTVSPSAQLVMSES
ncbi:hypothetical protein CsSME_00015028 [Camellia sinensis var. sinensis]